MKILSKTEYNSELYTPLDVFNWAVRHNFLSGMRDGGFMAKDFQIVQQFLLEAVRDNLVIDPLVFQVWLKAKGYDEQNK